MPGTRVAFVPQQSRDSQAGEEREAVAGMVRAAGVLRCCSALRGTVDALGAGGERVIHTGALTSCRPSGIATTDDASSLATHTHTPQNISLACRRRNVEAHSEEMYSDLSALIPPPPRYSRSFRTP